MTNKVTNENDKQTPAAPPANVVAEPKQGKSAFTAVYDALAPHVDEVMAGVRPSGVAKQIEIDLVVRQGNNVGIIEAKTGIKKAGIDQLDTAGNPHYLGDFLAKMLVTGRYLPRAHKALATAQEIRVIELPGYSDRAGLPSQDKQRLVQTVQQALAGR